MSDFKLGDDITVLTEQLMIGGVVATGLTVNVKVRRGGVLITTGVATHDYDGSYIYTLPGSLVTVAGTYTIYFEPTVEIDNKGVRIAVPAGLGGVEYLGSVAVQMTSPLTAQGNINIEQADDYYNEDSRALNFTFSDVPVLTGATSVKLKIGTLQISGTVISANQLRFQPTTAETQSLKSGPHEYEVEVILANGHRVTLQTGKATVRRTL